MELSRRLFLELMGLESLACLTGCRREESKTSSPAPTVSAIPDTTHYSLEQLLTEKNLPPQNYRGFPALVNEAGFQVLPMVDKKSERQVVIFAEDHTEEKAKRISNLIDILISRYGFDSIGLESFYGAPSSTMQDTVERDIRSIVGETYQIGRIGKIEIELDILRRDYSPQYDKYVHQRSILAYGLEDKSLFLNMAVIEAYLNILKNSQTVAEMTLHRASDGKTLIDLPKPIFRELSALLKRLREEHPDLSLPAVCLYDVILPPLAIGVQQYNRGHADFHEQLGTSCLEISATFSSIEELAEHRNAFQKGLDKFMSITQQGYKHDRRNQAMAKNIAQYMEQLNSKKGIIIVGEAHVFGRLRRTLDTVNTIPALIPYTSLAINATNHPL